MGAHSASRGGLGHRPTARYAFWWLHAPISAFSSGARLAVALPRATIVHWGSMDWRDAADEPTRDSGLGFHVAVLNVPYLPPGERVNLTSPIGQVKKT